MSILLDGTGGVTTPGVVNTAGETIATTLSVTGATNLGALTTTGNTILGDASTDTLNVGNGGLVKDASGNVGIGTASPSLKLHVNGSTLNSCLLVSNSTSGLNIGLAGNYATWQGTGTSDDFVIAGFGARNLILGTNGVQQATITSAGIFQFNSGYGSAATAYGCRAWVNFNGTGTVAIRGSGNVSSITDTGTGRYTVNFTTAMVDANYAVTSLSDGDGYVQINNGVAYSTTAIAIGANNMSNAGTDRAYVSVAVFR